MRVPYPALLWARQRSNPCAGHPPPTTAPGHGGQPHSHPEGHRAALPQELPGFSTPNRCRAEFRVQKKTKKTPKQRQTLQNNLLQSGECCRRLAAALAGEVPVEERSFLG